MPRFQPDLISQAETRVTPVIIAAEALTALGNLDKTWQGLQDGKSALRQLSVPGLPDCYPLGLVGSVAGEIGSPERLRSLLATVCSSLQPLAGIVQQADMIVATTKGAADGLLAAPNKTWQGQAWQVGDLAAEAAGCRGRVQTVSAACASGTLAIIHAAQRLITGQAEVLTVIGVDILSLFVLAGFASLQALDPAPCRPFAADRQGLSLGEGAGLLVMASQAFAAEHRLPVLARITGFGAASDATHITAPSREATGLKQVIRHATAGGTVSVGAINAHGTGTRYNDAMEMTAFSACWQEPPPIHSVKGALGHCLGAAGVIEAAIAVRSLNAGMIPPTPGHGRSDFPAARISGSRPLPLDSPSIFSCNSGFGGINAGILLTAPET